MCDTTEPTSNVSHDDSCKIRFAAVIMLTYCVLRAYFCCGCVGAKNFCVVRFPKKRKFLERSVQFPKLYALYYSAVERQGGMKERTGQVKEGKMFVFCRKVKS